MVTKEQAETLPFNSKLQHVSAKDSRGLPKQVRVSGKCKTWKTRPGDFKLPVKYGLFASGYITPSNAHEWQVSS